MGILQLRNHIPICGASNREPVDGTESPMRVSLGFEPAWYHQRCNVYFSQRWHEDPFYRYSNLLRVKADLVKRFPTVPYWDLAREDDLASISSCYGVCIIPQLFGIPVRYAPDRWPTFESGAKLSVRSIEALRMEDLLASPFMEDLLIQMDTMESEWGKIHGYPNLQGVLNNAFHIRGQEIFTDMLDRPEFVHRFFALICDVMIEFAKILQEKQRQSGFYIDQFSVSNCVINMISPDMYREFVLPYDKKISLCFERFGVHTCEWDVTPYIEAFKEITKLGHLDMGMQSDMKRVKETFPNIRRAVLYNAVKLQDADLEEIKRDMEKIYLELAPCDIVMADIQASTSDSRVNELLAICHNLESDTGSKLA